MKMGTNEVDNFMIGDSQVNKLMQGDVEVWSAVPPSSNIEDMVLVREAPLGGTPSGDGFFFTPDGSRIITCGAGYGGFIEQHDLTTPWDITNAQQTGGIGGHLEGEPRGVCMSTGFRVQTVGEDNGRAFTADYLLDSSYDLNSFSNQSFDSQYNEISSFFSLNISADGLKATMVVDLSDICVYDLLIAHSTTSIDIGSVSTFVPAVDITCARFDTSGTRLFVTSILDNGGDMEVAISQYDTTAPYDVSAPTLESTFVFLVPNSTIGTPMDLFISPDGLNIYILFNNNGITIRQYSVPTTLNVGA